MLKIRISKALKTVYSPHRSPRLRPSIDPPLYIRGVPSVAFPTGVMEILWNGQGRYAGEVVLYSGLLVDAGRDHRRYMKPRFIIISLSHGHNLVTDNHINTTIQPYKQLDW